MTTSPPIGRSRWQRCPILKGMAIAFGLFVLSVLFLVSGLRRFMERACADITELHIKNIVSALDMYRKKVGRYPTTAEGLHALVSRQVSESVPQDIWNREYHYALRGGIPLVWTYGADSLPGGEGTDADIYNISPLPSWLEERVFPPVTYDSSGLRCR